MDDIWALFSAGNGPKKSLLQNRYVAGPGHPSHLYGRLEAVCGGGLAKFGVIWSNPLVLATVLVFGSKRLTTVRQRVPPPPWPGKKVRDGSRAERWTKSGVFPFWRSENQLGPVTEVNAV